jgi:hypothetical protein
MWLWFKRFALPNHHPLVPVSLLEYHNLGAIWNGVKTAGYFLSGGFDVASGGF